MSISIAAELTKLCETFDVQPVMVEQQSTVTPVIVDHKKTLARINEKIEKLVNEGRLVFDG